MQAAVHAMVSYDGAASILGSAKTFITLTKRSEVEVINVLSRGWRIRSRRRRSVLVGRATMLCIAKALRWTETRGNNEINDTVAWHISLENYMMEIYWKLYMENF